MADDTAEIRIPHFGRITSARFMTQRDAAKLAYSRGMKLLSDNPGFKSKPARGGSW
jgi:hypothetical protein